jgi:hypothetical protein
MSISREQFDRAVETLTRNVVVQGMRMHNITDYSQIFFMGNRLYVSQDFTPGAPEHKSVSIVLMLTERAEAVPMATVRSESPDKVQLGEDVRAERVVEHILMVA